MADPYERQPTSGLTLLRLPGNGQAQSSTLASDHGQGTTTGVQCLTGQHIAGVGGGKHDHFGDFFGIARPSQRHRSAQLFEVFLGRTGLPPHRSMHRAGCDNCHHDAVFRFFKRQHLAELDDRGLRGATQRQTRVWSDRAAGGDIDDVSALLRSHLLEHGLTAISST